jgi:hypothetical protein
MKSKKANFLLFFNDSPYVTLHYKNGTVDWSKTGQSAMRDTVLLIIKKVLSHQISSISSQIIALTHDHNHDLC